MSENELNDTESAAVKNSFTSAPKEIFVVSDVDVLSSFWLIDEPATGGTVRYIRADIADERIAELEADLNRCMPFLLAHGWELGFCTHSDD